MKLLVVMVNYPFPPRTGSTIVAYNFMKHLSSRHHIDLICLRPDGDEIESADFVDSVELIPKKNRSIFFKWLTYVFYMLMGEPPSVSASASRPMTRRR